MGLITKHRKTYISHKKRWDKQTIVDEAVLVRDYALKNKKEVRKAEFMISKYKDIAKGLNRTTESKESEEAKRFIERLKKNGFLNVEASTLDEVLDLKVRDVLERRLSNIIYKNGLAKTPKQARQFVVHEHVQIGGRTVTSPSYLVTLEEEVKVVFNPFSKLSDENHPERRLEEPLGMEEMKKELEETPLKEEKGPSFDEKEAVLDDEEQNEVEK